MLHISAVQCILYNAIVQCIKQKEALIYVFKGIVGAEVRDAASEHMDVGSNPHGSSFY